MKPSKNAVNLIKEFESCSLKSYKCLPTEEEYTIGWGHYGVKANEVITESKAEEYLVQDMKAAQRAVNKYVPFYNFNQNQYDALISFAFNVGSIEGLTRKGKRTEEEIGTAITLYNKSAGKVIKGLVRRRKMESELYHRK